MAWIGYVYVPNNTSRALLKRRGIKGKPFIKRDLHILAAGPP
jgi:hypothetical protein